MKSKFCPTQAYAKDVGLAIVLILLLTSFWAGELYFILPAIGMLLVVMIIPAILKQLAVIWYYLFTALGNITNRIILAVIFGVVLTPIGIIRRCLGFDSMNRKSWKNGVNSVFTVRNHTFTSDDLNKPY